MVFLFPSAVKLTGMDLSISSFYYIILWSFIYTFIYILAAVKRCYQNLRRTHIESGLGKENYVENQSKQRKYRSRRQRVCSFYNYVKIATHYLLYRIAGLYPRHKFL